MPNGDAYGGVENYMKPKRKIKIPIEISDQVMYKSDLCCCICKEHGDQIHHIDSDPANNALENLAFLCFNHHNDATLKGGLRRKLSPGVILKYRNILYKKVEKKREMPSLTRVSDELFQIVIDAVSLREIQRIHARIDLDKPEKISKILFELEMYVPESGYRARLEILMSLLDIADKTRMREAKNISHLAHQIALLTYNALPIRNIREKSQIEISVDEMNLLYCGLEIGMEMAYDGALKRPDLLFVDAGGEVLWKLLRYSIVNGIKSLEEAVLRDFEKVIDAAKRGANKDALVLIELYKEHGLHGNWQYPEYPEDIADKLIKLKIHR